MFTGRRDSSRRGDGGGMREAGKRKSMHPTPSEERRFAYLMKRTTYSRLKFLRFGYIPPPRNFPYDLYSLRFFIKWTKKFDIKYSFLRRNHFYNKNGKNLTWKKFRFIRILSRNRRSHLNESPCCVTTHGAILRRNKFLRLASSYTAGCGTSGCESVQKWHTHARTQ